MGNRAVITASKVKGPAIAESDDIGVYLHWNGGRDSVEAFLAYCEAKGFRAPPDDYGFARLCQVIGNFFGGSVSLGVGRCADLDCDNGDNGVFLIDGWNIVGRVFQRRSEQEEYDLREMLDAINAAQPSAEQLSPEVLDKAVRKRRGVLSIDDLMKEV